MSRYEQIKSMILAILVLISLYLTWRLWSYQPSVAVLEDPQYIHVSIDQKKQLQEIVVPSQLIIHRNHNVFGTRNKNDIQTVHLAMRGWSLREFEELPKQSFNDLSKMTNRLDIIYPSKLSQVVFRNLLNVKKDAVLPDECDRIIFFNDTQNGRLNTYAWFVSYSKQQIFQARVTNITPSDFEQTYLHPSIHFGSYFTYEPNGQMHAPIYLPEKDMDYERLAYTAVHMPTNNFKNALFTDPNDVKHSFEEDGDETYIDGKRSLRVFDKGKWMNFINPIRNESGRMQSRSIVQSMEFINDHSGWTDHYELFDWEPDTYKEQTTFRLFLGNMPVFMNPSSYPQDLAIIYLSFRDGEAYEYRRSLLNISFEEQSIVHQKRTIPSGRDVIEQLNANQDIETKRIKNIVPAYDMHVYQNGTIVSFDPSWYVQYGSEWLPLGDLTLMKDESKGGMQNGLE